MFDLTLTGVMLAGLLSFLSPCILPMVPFYLSYLGGVSAHRVAEGDVTLDRRQTAYAVLAASVFAAGILTVFVGLGLSASAFGQALRDWFDWLRWGAAALIAGMGLHFLGVLRIGLLNRQFTANTAAPPRGGLIGAYVIGLAFAFGWTPCVGPVLAAILFVAADADAVHRGAALLLAYGVGMTVPFVLAAAFLGPFMSWMSRFRRHLGRIERITGVALVLFAVLIATNGLTVIGLWMIENMSVFQGVG